MSESEKKIIVDDLDFDSLSGGVEVREQPEVKPLSILQAKGQKTKYKNDYIIPIQVGEDTVIKDLRDVSGEEFLAWAESVYSPLRTQRLDPDLYDGPRNIENKKNVVNAIAKFYHDILQRRGFNSSILH